MGCNARFSYPDNRLFPGIHYGPDELAVFAAYRAGVRMVLALSVAKGISAYHIEVSAACLHEDYDGPTPIYMHHIPAFYVNHDVKPNTMLQVRKNIYGTRHELHKHAMGMHKILTSAGYRQSQANGNVCTRRCDTGRPFSPSPSMTVA